MGVRVRMCMAVRMGVHQIAMPMLVRVTMRMLVRVTLLGVMHWETSLKSCHWRR